MGKDTGGRTSGVAVTVGARVTVQTISAGLFHAGGHYGFPCVVFRLPLSPHLLVVSLLVSGTVSF